MGDLRASSSGPVTGPPPPRDAGVAPPGTEVLLREECYELLATATVGRIVFVWDGWPVALPVNYVLDGDDVVFRTGLGTKLLAAGGRPRVAFEVDAVDGRYESGWSVLLHGTAAEVTDQEGRRRAGGSVRAWARGPKEHWVRVRALQVTGRRLVSSWSYPDPPPPSS